MRQFSVFELMVLVFHPVLFRFALIIFLSKTHCLISATKPRQAMEELQFAAKDPAISIGAAAVRQYISVVLCSWPKTSINTAL